MLVSYIQLSLTCVAVISPMARTNEVLRRRYGLLGYKLVMPVIHVSVTPEKVLLDVFVDKPETLLLSLRCVCSKLLTWSAALKQALALVCQAAS